MANCRSPRCQKMEQRPFCHGIRRWLKPRVLFHNGSSMIGDFCCGMFYQFSKETFETLDEAKKALDEGSYATMERGWTSMGYYGSKGAVELGLCTLVEVRAPDWTGVETNSMMIPLPESMIHEWQKHEGYLSEEEIFFLKERYTKAQWDAAEAKAKAELGED